ncbi:RNA polymerase sigma factor [Luxibacter massiliensis]|uniref:RNA polymerase sigma factor n=1 Tax=Luxibacter massiliensis TaxID=2219695 RepID=UPI002ECFE5D3
MNRVYTLREGSCADGVMKYFISFKDSTGVFQSLDVLKELYFAFRQLERKNRTLQQSDQHHKEFNEVYEETLNRRARYIPKSVEEIIIETERSELLYKAINSLPEIQRRRFLLYYEYDYSNYEIAAMENCTAQAVRRSVIIAKEKVKAQMKQYLCA